VTNIAKLPFAILLSVLTAGALYGQAIPDAAWSTEIGVHLDSPGHIMQRAATGFDDGYHQGAPVGGIGAGTFSRSDRGDFNRWHLKAGSHTAQPVYADQFLVFEQQEGDAPVAQALMAGHPEGRLSRWKWDYPAGAGRYAALYPKAWWDYKWEKFPAHLVLEQFSPILPGDYKTSGLPVAIYRWHAENPGKKPVKVSILLSWQNMAGWFRQFSAPLNEKLTEGDTNRFEEVTLPEGGKMAGIVLGQRRSGDAREEWQGEFAIAAEEGHGVEVSYQTTYDPSDATGDVIWKPFSQQGRLANDRTSWVSTGDPQAAAICISFVLQPGEKKTVPIVLSWDFPVVQFGGGRKWLRHYTRFTGASGHNALKIAEEGLENQQAWSEKIDRWQKPFIENVSRPAWLTSMMLNELYCGRVLSIRQMLKTVLRCSSATTTSITLRLTLPFTARLACCGFSLTSKRLSSANLPQQFHSTIQPSTWTFGRAANRAHQRCASARCKGRSLTILDRPMKTRCFWSTSIRGRTAITGAISTAILS
jgi:non-lysosomal glucosylceramidase